MVLFPFPLLETWGDFFFLDIHCENFAVLSMVRLSNFGSSSGCIVIPYVVLIYTSLIIDIEHLFVCSFALYVSTLVKCLLKSFVHYFIELFAYWVWRVIRLYIFGNMVMFIIYFYILLSVYLFYMQVLCQIYALQIFPHCLRYSFHFLNRIF